MRMEGHLWSFLLVGAFIGLRAKADVSLDLTSVGNPASDIYIGETRTLRVVATFDADKVYHGVRIELLPSTSSLVFALSEVISATNTGCTNISNPSTKADIVSHMFSDTASEYDRTKDIVAYKSRAELDLGTVKSGSGSCAYTIEYQIEHVSLGNQNVGAIYWTSVGMEYTDAGLNYIWASQVDSVLKDVKPSPNLSYNYSVKPVCGPDAVFHPGSVEYFDIEITTDRGKVAGPMIIEVPIPDNPTEPLLTFVNAKVVSKGKNVVCTALGNVSTKLSDWVSGSNESDRVVMNLPMVCNVQDKDSVDEDKFTVRIGVRIKDLPAVLDGNMTQVNFSLGLTVSDQIWVFTTTANVINAMHQLTPASPAFVKGIVIPNNEVPATWPTGFDLEWSLDNRKFYPSESSWFQQSASTKLFTFQWLQQSVRSDWDLEEGLMGYWFRLVSKDGGCLPASYQLKSERWLP
ncbi:uncharacterized protein LOC127844991 [Dreissena polymorpha]|uniref:Uncharacterized protein n=1 Tax=Dreissena polymorpha TaxID=45954 RepID=A0A9D4ILS4_DREPO|nr:uncharacterized protein LOC127844991 [Dreissena polymorpha]KAH3777604.1 hypothetical protein DPMN_179052 [Dreissena polymorpha]